MLEPDLAAIQLQPADLIFTRGDSVVGTLIRSFTTEQGEKRSVVNHVAGVVHGGDLKSAIICEALHRVTVRGLWQGYADTGTELTIWRCNSLSQHAREAIAVNASGRKGQKYGYIKILFEAGDFWLTKVRGKKTRFFRRFGFIDSMPICSRLWAEEYEKVGIALGGPAREMDPDDMHDWVKQSPAWEKILPLSRIP